MGNSAELIHHDLSLLGEAWREYDFAGRVYRIDRPVNLWYGRGGSTHRVEDVTGVVHLVPAPGHYGCVVRWAKLEGYASADF